MFGLRFVKSKEIKELKETMTVFRRHLEDIGWNNLTEDNSQDIQGAHLQDIIKRSRQYYDNNALAGHWVELTTAFIFGEGITKPKAKDEKIQEIINEFWEDVDNQKTVTTFLAQQLICNKLQYEGNLFFLLFDDEEGNVKVRVLNSLDVVDIIMDEEDKMRPMFYKVAIKERKFNFSSDSYDTAGVRYVYYPSIDNFNPEEKNIPPSKLITDAKVFHVKTNCDINSKFGIPSLYRGLDWMKAHKDMAGDLATLVKALSQFAWKKKVKGSQTQINTLMGAMTSKINLSNIRNSAGRTQFENQNLDLQSIDVKTGGVKVGAEGLHQMKLMISAASHISETYFGDASNSNLATSRSLELPMFKVFTTYQCLWTEIYSTIIQYVINKKIEVGLLDGTNEFNSKTQRMIFETEVDRHVDIDFPPLVEANLKEWSDALSGAKNGGLISKELASQLFMLAANVNNIDEEIEKLKEEWVENEKKAEEIAGQNQDKNLKSLEKADKKDDKTKVKSEIASELKEAIDNPIKLAEIRLAKKSNYVQQRMNGYTKALRLHFTTLKKDLREACKATGAEGKIVGNVLGLNNIVLRFQENMRASSRAYFPVAVQIGEKFAQATLKDYGIDIMKTLYEARGKATDVLREKLMWNDEYISASLIPDIEESVMKEVRQEYKTSEEFKAKIVNSVGKFEGRIQQYAGAFWHVEESAVKAAISGTGLLANFAGANDSATCADCANAIAGNPYTVDNIPTPGEFPCAGNCRHVIQIISPTKG